MKRIFALLLLLATGLGLFSCALAPKEAEPTGPETTAVEETVADPTASATEASAPEPIVLKIVSLNTQNAGYDRSGEATLTVKYQKLAAAIDAKTPDLVFLQECNTVAAADGIRQQMADGSNYATVSGRNASTMILFNTKVFTPVSHGCEQIGAKDD